MFSRLINFIKLYIAFTRDYFLYAFRIKGSNGYYHKPSIAIDFDGVIAHYEKGMASRNEIGKPMWMARTSLLELSKEFHIIIWTSRPITRELYKWFKENEIPYDRILPKPQCWAFIDDSAISFKGDWKETMKRIRRFKKWWE